MFRIHLLILVMLLSWRVALAVDPSPFTLRAPLSPAETNAHLQGITYAGGKFVTVGYKVDQNLKRTDLVRQSPAGVGWGLVQITNGWEFFLKDVIYANGIYVATGGTDGGEVRTSLDGLNWTNSPSLLCCAMSGVTFGSAGFVAVGTDFYTQVAPVFTSPDSFTWTYRNSGLTNVALNAVTFGNGLYVAVGNSGAILTSSDTTNWIKRANATATFHLFGIIYTNGSFVAVGSSGTLRTSPNGTNWTTITTGLAETFRAIIFANDTYVAVGAKGTIAISTNLFAWTKLPASTTFDLYDVTYGNGSFVAVGDGGTILQSRDFLRPQLTIINSPSTFDLVVSPSEFNHPYRIQSSSTPGFEIPNTLLTYSNSHTNIILHGPKIDPSRFYRVVSP
jgi:hypothetical protein